MIQQRNANLIIVLAGVLLAIVSGSLAEAARGGAAAPDLPLAEARWTSCAWRTADTGCGGGFVQASTAQQRRRSQHFPHPGPSPGAFIADNHHVSRLNFTAHNRLCSLVFRVEHPGRPLMHHHAGVYRRFFDYSAIRRQVAEEHGQSSHR